MNIEWVVWCGHRTSNMHKINNNNNKKLHKDKKLVVIS